MMDALLKDSMLCAKLPLLGPLIGATRPDGAGLAARVWIQVDNTQNEPPLFALTALWNSKLKCVCPGSARAWKLTVAVPAKMDPPSSLHFAVANIKFPPATGDCVIRMVSMHRIAGSDLDTQVDLMTCRIDDAAPLKLAPAAMQMTQGLAGQALPEPTEASMPSGFRDLAQRLDQLAMEAFAQIEVDLADTKRRMREPIRSTRSRWMLTPRCITECEADLAASSRTHLASTGGAIGFAATCCRHPGVGWDSERADQTFGLLGDAAGNPAGPAFALLVGDQIYADATAGAFDVADRFEKFSVRYEDAFGARRFRRCASRLPLYMAADDHEIEDNWSLSRLHEAQVPEHQLMRRRRLAAWAQMMYIAYQRLHGPRSPDLKRGWYDFKAAGVPFFVMDTRFERDAGVPRICGKDQIDALRNWLDEVRELDAKGHALEGAPKFIVSGSVFAPGLAEFVRDPASARRADNWQEFPGDRAALAHAIVQRNLRNVVFLSGDYHCGAVAEIEWPAPAAVGKAPLTAYAIVSPPAYAPFPFANVKAGEVAREEALASPPGARIRAEAWEGGGYALIRIGRDPGKSWCIDVDFHDPATDRRFSRHLVLG